MLYFCEKTRLWCLISSFLSFHPNIAEKTMSADFTYRKRHFGRLFDKWYTKPEIILHHLGSLFTFAHCITHFIAVSCFEFFQFVESPFPHFIILCIVFFWFFYVLCAHISYTIFFECVFWSCYVNSYFFRSLFT